MKKIITKKIIKEAAEFSNFCQWLKMKMWKVGYKGEKKMDKLAEDIFKYFYESQRKN